MSFLTVRLADDRSTAATPRTPRRRLTHLSKATETPQAPDPLYCLSVA
jgi:hypothetical protein